MNLHELFVEPWLFGDWMWRAVVAGLLVSIPCSILGCFLYLRRMSMLVDAVSHVALPGIVAAYLVAGKIEGPAMLIGATLAGLLSSILIATVQRIPTVKPDAAIGIVFTSMFAAGIIILTVYVHGVDLDVQCVLFGDILAISDSSLWTLGIVAPFTVISILLFWRWFSVTSFDPGFSAAIGLPVVAIHYGLMILASLTTVAGFEAVGSILVLAFVVTPAATAHRITDRLETMALLAIGQAIVSTIAGVYISIWFNISTTGAIVSVSTLIYLGVYLFAPSNGKFVSFFRSSKTLSTTENTVEEGALLAKG